MNTMIYFVDLLLMIQSASKKTNCLKTTFNILWFSKILEGPLCDCNFSNDLKDGFIEKKPTLLHRFLPTLLLQFIFLLYILGIKLLQSTH